MIYIYIYSPTNFRSYNLSPYFFPPRSLWLLCLLPHLCSSSLLAMRMVSFPVCLIQESHLLGLEKKGFIPSREVLGWRLEGEGEVPHPGDDEVVMLASLYEHRLGLPLHPITVGSSTTISWKFRTFITTLFFTSHASSCCVRRWWGSNLSRCCGSISSARRWP
jgi:hypothetical protein